MSLILRAAAISDPGLIRANNEDVAYAGTRLIGVADGIGGQPAGEMASEITINALASLDQSMAAGSDPTPDANPLAALRAAISTANRQIREAIAADPASQGMGTTVTALLLTGDQLAIVHVGDSRCYLLRDGVLQQLTRDDTFVQSLIDNGVLTVDAARSHPQRSIITSAVQGADLTPSTGTLAGLAGDRLLLCSDGLSDVVPDQVIAQSLVSYLDLRQCAEQLVKLAHQAGAPDNVTVVVADLVTDPAQAGAAAR